MQTTGKHNHLPTQSLIMAEEEEEPLVPRVIEDDFPPEDEVEEEDSAYDSAAAHEDEATDDELLADEDEDLDEEPVPMPLPAGFSSPHVGRHVAVVSPHVNPPSPQWREWATANGGKPPLANIFAATNNTETGNTFLFEAERAIAIIRQVVTTQPDADAKDCSIIRSDLHSYQRAVQNGVVAKVIRDSIYGYNKTYAADNASIAARCLKMERDKDTQGLAFFNAHAIPFIDYVFNYEIPATCKVSFDEVKNKNVDQFCNNMKRAKGRSCCPVFSNAWLQSQKPFRRNITNSACCNGHLLDYVLILDKVVENFVDSLSCQTQYVLARENFQARLNVSRGLRHW